MQVHQPFNESSQLASAPTPKLLRQIGFVPKEYTPRSHFLLKKRVNIAATPHSPGKLRELCGTALECKKQADGIESKLLHARQFRRKARNVSCKYGIDQGHEAVVFADCSDGIKRGGIGPPWRLGARVEIERELLDLSACHTRVERRATGNALRQFVGQQQANRIRHFADRERDRAEIRRMEHGDKCVRPIDEQLGDA